MSSPSPDAPRISHADLLELRRWNTPTIYNGWEQITRRNALREGFNLEPVTDYMPAMGPMVGFAVTVVIQPSDGAHPQNHPNAWSEYRAHVAAQPGPKIVVVQDLDKPRIYGAFWGEVNSNIHKALGCIGTIIDGGIRDVDEIHNAGFKAIARGMAVGHAASCPIRWGCEVEVFGARIQPGQLIHADKHGFLAVPREDELKVLEAARFMDSNECQTMIPAARDAAGRTSAEVLANFNTAAAKFSSAARAKFNRTGEW